MCVHMCMSYFPMHCQACHGCALDEKEKHANSAELSLASLHRRPRRRPTVCCTTRCSSPNCQRRRLSQQPCCEPSETLANCFMRFLPKATAKGSFEKSTTIKDCRSDRCLERLSSKTTEVIRVLKDCHQRLPK